MLAGSPVELNVTALIKEPVEAEVEAIPTVIEDTDGDIAETTLDPIAGAAAAIEEAEAIPTVLPESPPPAAAATPKPKPKSSSLGKPYIQIGIFSVKANAEQAANQMRAAGMVPTVFEQSRRLIAIN